MDSCRPVRIFLSIEYNVCAEKDSDGVKTLEFVIASAAKQSPTPIRARAGIASLRSQ